MTPRSLARGFGTFLKRGKHEEEVLEFIKSFEARNGYGPKKGEILLHVGLSAPNLARILHELREQGKLQRVNRAAAIRGLTEIRSRNEG